MKGSKFSKNLILFLVLAGLLLIPVVSLGLFRYTGESNVLSFSDIRKPSLPKLDLAVRDEEMDDEKVPTGPTVDLPSNFIITKYVAN